MDDMCWIHSKKYRIRFLKEYCHGEKLGVVAVFENVQGIVKFESSCTKGQLFSKRKF